MKIADIYAGKLDASDEIRESGFDLFRKNYISPSGVNVEKLASTKFGTPILIKGDKGTGKTALIHYLENYVCQIDASACSSFISFDKDYSGAQRSKFNAIVSIQIDQSLAMNGENVENSFIHIWKWQLYQKIIEDNDCFNNGLFEDDDNWQGFVSRMKRIGPTINKQKMLIPAAITISAKVHPDQGVLEPGVTIEPVDLSQKSFNSTKGYKEFEKIIEEADCYIQKIKRKDVPYYVFIDELEAYRGNNDIFLRDLRLIRDLLFVVKYMNDVFQTGTKIICSVRPEILNAINRFVQSNQLHKITLGFDETLVWEYKNTNSFNHPIIGVLLRRIQNAEEKNGGDSDINTIIDKWFEPEVYGKHICTYILDNTWHKPRDIVRMLLSAQARSSRESSRFNQNVFETFMPTYSKQCLDELKEEMRALYTVDEIDGIMNCLQGYRSSFFFSEIVNRAKRLYPQGRLATDPHTVINDLYRMGILGNTKDRYTTPHWYHKGQYALSLEEPWKLIVHPALCLELSVKAGGEKKRGLSKAQTKVYTATVKHIRNKYMLVSFEKDGSITEGYISLNQIGVYGIQQGEIDLYYSKGDSLQIVVKDYNPEYNNWFARVCSRTIP